MMLGKKDSQTIARLKLLYQQVITAWSLQLCSAEPEQKSTLSPDMRQLLFFQNVVVTNQQICPAGLT